MNGNCLGMGRVWGFPSDCSDTGTALLHHENPPTATPKHPHTNPTILSKTQQNEHLAEKCSPRPVALTALPNHTKIPCVPYKKYPENAIWNTETNNKHTKSSTAVIDFHKDLSTLKPTSAQPEDHHSGLFWWFSAPWIPVWKLLLYITPLLKFALPELSLPVFSQNKIIKWKKMCPRS